MKVNRYTQAVIAPRQTAQLTDASAVANAGAGFRAVAQVSSGVASKLEEFRIADLKTKVNEDTISLQKDAFDLEQSLKKQTQGNPKEYVPQFEAGYKELVAKYDGQYDDKDAKEAFSLTAGRLSLSYYQNGVNWTQQRSASLYSERVKDANDKNSLLAYEAAQAGKGYEQFLKNADANGAAASGVVAPEMVQNVRQESRSAAAASYMQGLVDSGQLLQADKIIKSGDLNEELGVSRLSALTKSIRKGRDTINNLQFTDPAAYAVQYGGATTPAEIAQGQLDRGVPVESVSIIPSKAAKQQAGQIMNIQNAQQFTQTMESLKNQYGETYLPNALADLKRAGLPENFAYAMELDPATDSDLLDVYFDSIKDPDSVNSFAAEKLKANAKTVGDLQNDVFERQSEMMDMFAAEGKGGSAMRSIQKSSFDMAKAHYARYGDYNAAVDASTEWMEDKVAIGSSNGSEFRIVKDKAVGYDVNTIEYGANIVLEDVEILPAANVPDSVREFVGVETKDTARWVLNHAGDGLQLIDDKFMPLADTSGNLIEYTYEEFHERGKVVFEERGRQQKSRVDESRERNRRAEESPFLFPNKAR